MADNFAFTPGTGATGAADDIGGVLYARVKLSQGADGSATDVSSADPLQVSLANTVANTNKLLVTPDLPTGASTAANQTSTNTKLDTVIADIVAATLPVGAGTATAAGRVTTASNDPSRPRFFAVVGGTLTRPANTTAYAANDAVSNNATAGSVTAQTASLSDTNDDPISIERITVATTDTGLAAAKNIRVYIFNSDPTANTGVGGGDNAAWSQKQAGFVGSLSGAFRAFSDGGKAVLTPDEGSRIFCTPVSGAKTVYILYQTLDIFTPSANSTTLIPTFEGYQGRV